MGGVCSIDAVVRAMARSCIDDVKPLSVGCTDLPFEHDHPEHAYHNREMLSDAASNVYHPCATSLIWWGTAKGGAVHERNRAFVVNGTSGKKHGAIKNSSCAKYRAPVCKTEILRQFQKVRLTCMHAFTW